MNGKMSNMVPFNVPPGNRNVAGDFHRPYEGRFPFNVPPGNRDVAGDFHRPYEACHSSGRSETAALRFPFNVPLLLP